MRKFLTYLSLGVILIGAVANSGCALLALAKQGQYRCSISGEPDPVTSEDFFNRAVKHAEMSKTDLTGDFDECA